MSEIKLVHDSDFESKLVLPHKKNTQLENSLIHFTTPEGLNAYNLYYNDLQKYVLRKVDAFNDNLRAHYRLNYCKSSVLLNLNQKSMNHYTVRFPQKQYVSKDPLDDDLNYILKPACCNNALKIWKLQGARIRRKEIIHQVSDCYRREPSGTVRSFKRTSCFTMPDYHMTTVESDMLEDMALIRRNIFSFYNQIIGPNWADSFMEIVRVDRGKYELYRDYIDKFANESPCKDVPFHVQLMDYEGAEPYYELKYQIAYRKSNKVYAVGTIQIDYVYPELFELRKDVYGLKPVIHFTMGSIIRIIDVLITENKVPRKGYKLYCIQTDPSEFMERVRSPCAVLIDNTSKNLKESICSNNYYERQFFPLLCVYGPKEKNTRTVTIIDRTLRVKAGTGDSKNDSFSYVTPIDSFVDYIQKQYVHMNNKELHYTYTFCN